MGIFTTKDLMRRALAAHKNPSTCLVQEVMTPNPEYATLDTAIVDALHLMHDGKFLYVLWYILILCTVSGFHAKASSVGIYP